MSQHKKYVNSYRYETLFFIEPHLLNTDIILINQGVAQLVARTAGGREVAGSSPVTLTIELFKKNSPCIEILMLYILCKII